ncbi:UNVERIFIED_ORG: hypothetical protein ABIB63_000049 [Xanthomonas axonopodis]
MSSNWPPAATSAGRPRVRDRIAVCEVGPPLRSGQAEHARGVQVGGVRRRQVAGEQDARLFGQVGETGAGGGRVELGQYAAADVAQIGRAAGQHRVAEGGQAGGHLFHRLVPRPRHAVAFDHQLAGAGDQVGVVEQFGLGLEDGRVRGTEPALGVVLDRRQLLAGAGQRVVQLRATIAQAHRLIGHFGLRGAQAVHDADRHARAGADADNGRLRLWRRPAGHRGGATLRGALGIGLFLRGEAVHDGAQALEQFRRVAAFGRDGDAVAGTQAQLQQADQALGIGGLVAGAHLRTCGKAACGLGPAGGRARVQAAGVGDGPLECFGQVGGRRGIGLGRTVAGECGHDHAGVVGTEQRFELGRVLDQPGQPAQQGDVGIGLRGDADHQPGDLAGVPFHAVGQLQHCNAVAAHQVAVFADAVRDRQAVAEEGVRQAFAAPHAGVVARRHAAGRDQQLGGLGDGVVLVAGGGAQAHKVGGDRGWRRRGQDGLRMRSGWEV